MNPFPRLLMVVATMGALWSAAHAADSLPYKGTPQKVPGTIAPGNYDEGGSGVAYQSSRKYPKNVPQLMFRSDEIGWTGDNTHGIVVGPAEGAVTWINYTVQVAKAGEYDVVLFMNRPDYWLKDTSVEMPQLFELEVDGKKAAAWELGSKWVNGKSFRVPVKEVGRQMVTLESGTHKLTMRFDRVKAAGFHFGGLTFSTAVKGALQLPATVTVFGPFTRDDGIPNIALLRTVPDELEIGGKQVAGRPATLTAERTLELQSFTGPNVGDTAWVFFSFAATSDGQATFGFGADWWYEAYLDGKVISETVSRGNKGNEAWPPSIRDFTATVEVSQGAHILAVRMLRGSGSALLAVGGPEDLRNPAIKTTTVPKRLPNVIKALTREGPPAGKQWKMVWNDEFDGKEIDLSRWAHGAEAPYTPPENDPNTRLDGQGSLVCTLTLDQQGNPVYGGIHTRSFEKAYGYFETQVQFTAQPGWWSAVWLHGRTFYHNGGSDPFLFPQEFDMFEDFCKPKRRPDISHCYHSVFELSSASDQGNGKGIGGSGMSDRKEVGRVSSGHTVTLEEYGGWHTVGFEWTPLEHIWYIDGQETLRQTYRDVPVTSAPQIVKIGGVFRSPPKSKQAGGQEPFYGWLEEAKLPDQLKVDYFRVYDVDHAGKEVPQVTVTLENAEAGTLHGKPATFRVRAGDKDGTVKALYLFSKGHIRAESTVDAATVDKRFTVSNLFSGRNTVIAMAKDNEGRIGMSTPLRVDVLSGREYTGTAFQGKPQQVPGKIFPGRYDEGGNGAAFFQEAGLAAQTASTWRGGEVKNATEDALPVGQVDCGVPWLTYQVDVRESGWYDVELLMSRGDYAKSKFYDLLRGVSEPVRLEVDRAKVAEWKLDAQWDSGTTQWDSTGWKAPVLPVGRQRVRLEKGPHQLIMRFDELLNSTVFGGLVFTRATPPRTPRASAKGRRPRLSESAGTMMKRTTHEE